MANLDLIADRQAQWSESAGQLKKAVDGARWTAFALSISGALLAALASQMPAAGSVALVSSPRSWIALMGALCLGGAAFVTQRLLAAQRVSGWVRARAISEGLKREAFRFAAGVAPYDDPDRDKAAALLDAERRKIESDGDDLLEQLATTAGKGSAPRALITPDEYVTRRVDDLIKWYMPRAARYRATATRLRRIEFALAALATVTAAAAGVFGKASLGIFSFDFAAWTAVLTTIGGTVVAHIEASRYDFLAVTYRATARRLEDLRGRPRAAWSDFVNECESILSAENASWTAKWTK